MLELFSPRSRHSTWRQLWLWLAEGEKEGGLDIPDDALAQMKAHLKVTDDEFQAVVTEERRRRHDVMAHVHVFGQSAPAAAGIIHLGATSCYVTDNTELILLRSALDILIPKLAGVIHNLRNFASEHKDLPCLAYTHFQPAQPTTVGKRACLWIYDLLQDLKDLRAVREDIRFRGVKGTTGSQASFLELFDGDDDKVEALDAYVTRAAGFGTATCPVTSQTYSRRQDLKITNALATLAATATKMCGDIRHLAGFGELEEPFEKDQIGSSAMAYKRNPMRAERVCSLARLLMEKPAGAANTFANQWLERSLDDSAARRVDLPEMNLLADAILIILDNVTLGFVVYPGIIARRLQEELPSMATESMIMALSRKGVSRQEAHEKIRVHSHAARAVAKEGKENDFINRTKADSFFAPIHEEIDTLLEPRKFVGRAPKQVEKFLSGDVKTALEPYQEYLAQKKGATLSV